MKTTAVTTSLAASLLLLSACSDDTPSDSGAADDYPSGPVSMYAGSDVGLDQPPAGGLTTDTTF